MLSQVSNGANDKPLDGIISANSNQNMMNIAYNLFHILVQYIDVL